MPSRVLTNADLERIVDTSDEWIVERTGIRERRLIEDGQRQSDLGNYAAQEALDRAGVRPDQVDLVIVGTVTPDHSFPSSANTIAGKLGIVGPPSFDITAACSGFAYAMHQGVCAVESGRADRVLVIGSEVMSSIVDWSNRNTCVLFGDGAGAVLLEEVREPFGIVDIVIGSDGRDRYYEILNMPAGGSAMPPSRDTVENGLHYLRMNGSEVYKLAVKNMCDISNMLMRRNRLRASDIGCFVAHQANLRIIEASAKRLGLKPSQVYTNIQRYGNTTSATIPTALYEAEAEGKIRRGSWVLCVTFGAGLTWGGFLMRWAVRPLPKPAALAGARAASDSYLEQLRPDRDWER